MILPLRIRFLAALVAVLLAIGSSMSAARADTGPHDTNPAPAPTASPDDHHDGEETPDMARSIAGGNARRYSDGQKLSYRVEVSQSIQPRGPHPAQVVSSSMELLLTETVTVDDDGPLVTLEVAEASAQGFLADAEQAEALDRRVQFRPGEKQVRFLLKNGEDGKPDLLDGGTVAPYGATGTIRMIDLVMRAHLLNPVIPASEYADGDSFIDTAALPAGWALGYLAFDGSTTVESTEVQNARDVVRVKGVHVTGDTLLRVRAMENAMQALQGNEKPEPNDFFAGTIFNALFPAGSTYESLMPKLPLPAVPAERRRKGVRRPHRRRRVVRVLLGCLMAIGMASCSDPARNVDVVSLNLSGPMQIDHSAVIDGATGVVITSQANAKARLAGSVYEIPTNIVPLLPPPLSALSGAEVGMDVDWTVTEQLQGDVPEPVSLFNSPNSSTLLIAGAVVAALGLIVGVGLIRRKRALAAPAESRESGDL